MDWTVYVIDFGIATEFTNRTLRQVSQSTIRELVTFLSFIVQLLEN